jgi:hypothetical protein
MTLGGKGFTGHKTSPPTTHKTSPPTTFLGTVIIYVHNAVTLLASLQSFHDNCSFCVRNANKAVEILSEGGGKAADILYSDLEINVSSPTATFLIAFRAAPSALTVSQHFPLHT